MMQVTYNTVFRFLRKQLCFIDFCGIHSYRGKLNPDQAKLLQENCITVDENDKVIGPMTKKECHLMENIKKGLTHRGFSVFLFNNKAEFLLQQRSDAKITFPGYFSNTCCSHPLYFISELEEENSIGMKRAAKRRLQFELGINPDNIDLDDFQIMTRILYTAPYDDKWGEREITYLIFIQKDVEINPNSNEVKDYIYLPRNGIKQYLDDLQKNDEKLTPWFKLFADKFLFYYWNNLDNLKLLSDMKTIHKFQE